MKVYILPCTELINTYIIYICYTMHIYIAYSLYIATHTASYTLGSMSSSLHSSSQGYPPTSVTKLSKLAFPSKPCTQSI
jgi:hypothetical protein